PSSPTIAQPRRARPPAANLGIVGAAGRRLSELIARATLSNAAFRPLFQTVLMTQLIGSRMRFATPRHSRPIRSTVSSTQPLMVSSPPVKRSNTLDLIQSHTARNDAFKVSHAALAPSTARPMFVFRLSIPVRNTENTLRSIQSHTARNADLTPSHARRAPTTGAFTLVRRASITRRNTGNTLRSSQAHATSSAATIASQSAAMSSARSENHEATAEKPALMASNTGRRAFSHSQLAANATRSKASPMTLEYTSQMNLPTAAKPSPIALKIGSTLSRSQPTAAWNPSIAGCTSVL